jgi:hypothetical protein
MKASMAMSGAIKAGNLGDPDPDRMPLDLAFSEGSLFGKRYYGRDAQARLRPAESGSPGLR